MVLGRCPLPLLYEKVKRKSSKFPLIILSSSKLFDLDSILGMYIKERDEVSKCKKIISKSLQMFGGVKYPGIDFVREIEFLPNYKKERFQAKKVSWKNKSYMQKFLRQSRNRLISCKPTGNRFEQEEPGEFNIVLHCAITLNEKIRFLINKTVSLS